jgi:DNA-binding CsgD family transcriptional regulator
MLNANALSLTGPFKALSLEGGYAVALLSLAAIAFYFLPQPLVPKPDNTAETTVPPAAPMVPIPDIAAVFREHNLSEREMEVALLMAQEGLNNKEMGNRLYISPLTVRDHVTSVYRKFDVKGRAQFMAKILNKDSAQ